MWHLIISHQGVIWTGTDTARTPERDRTSAKNVALLLFLLFRCIGERTPTVHALFPGFCGVGMRIARRPARIIKYSTFPPGVVFGLALLGRDFLFLLACLETFIGEVHLDGSRSSVPSQDSHIFIDDNRRTSASPLPLQLAILSIFAEAAF
jgi:hypothetical protein